MYSWPSFHLRSTNFYFLLLFFDSEPSRPLVLVLNTVKYSLYSTSLFASLFLSQPRPLWDPLFVSRILTCTEKITQFCNVVLLHIRDLFLLPRPTPHSTQPCLPFLSWLLSVFITLSISSVCYPPHPIARRLQSCHQEESTCAWLTLRASLQSHPKTTC